jgi:streptogramin lyase
MLRRALVALLLAVNALADPEIRLPAGRSPLSIVTAADGSLWYAAVYLDPTTGVFPYRPEIGHVLPNGTIESVQIPRPFYYESNAPLVALPDGGVAVADYIGTIVTIDRAMNVTARVALNEGSTCCTPVSAMTYGADGNLWFIADPETGPMFLGRLTQGGEVTRFPLPGARLIVSAPDGTLLLAGGCIIYRATMAGTVTRINSCEDLNCRLEWMEVGSDGTVWTSCGRLLPDGSYVSEYRGGRDAVRGADDNIWIAPHTNALRAYAKDGSLARELPLRDANTKVLSIASSGDMIWYGVAGAIRGYDIHSPFDLRLRLDDMVTVDLEPNCNAFVTGCFEGEHPVLAFHHRGDSPFLRRIERSPGNEYEDRGIFAVDASQILREEDDDRFERDQPPIATIFDAEGVRRGVLAGPQKTYGQGIVVDRGRRIHALRMHSQTGEQRLLTYAQDGTLLQHLALPIPNWLEMEAIDLASDQCTLYYIPYSSGQGTISRLDICTGAVLSDFVTNLPERGRDLRILPDGGILAVFRRRMVRFRPDGTIAKEYDAPKDDDLRSVALDRDPAYVWIGASGLWRIELATGRIVERVPVYGAPQRISIIGEPRAARTPVRRRATRQ